MPSPRVAQHSPLTTAVATCGCTVQNTSARCYARKALYTHDQRLLIVVTGEDYFEEFVVDSYHVCCRQPVARLLRSYIISTDPSAEQPGVCKSCDAVPYGPASSNWSVPSARPLYLCSTRGAQAAKHKAAHRAHRGSPRAEPRQQPRYTRSGGPRAPRRAWHPDRLYSERQYSLIRSAHPAVAP